MTAEAPAVKKVKRDAVVEVKLWETYLLYHPGRLYQLLAEYSLDNGPLECENYSGKVVFRFGVNDWETKIEPLLNRYRIPVMRSFRNNPS